MTIQSRALALGSFAGLVALAACDMKFSSGGDTCNGTNYSVQNVYVLVDTSVSDAYGGLNGYYVELGDSLELETQARGQDCQPVAASFPAFWRTTTPSILTVKPTGPNSKRALVNTKAVGHGLVVVEMQNMSGNLNVGVVQRIGSFTIHPTAATIKAGDSVFVQVTATHVDGNPVTDLRPGYPYSTETEGQVYLGHVGASPWGAWVYSHGPGQMVITVQLLGHSATSTITVVP